MRHLRIALAAAILVAGGAAEARAQEAVTGATDSAAADTTPHKKGGLFGKMKKVVKNKAVQKVAKVAACTMVPGGQAIAGAIDAAGSGDAAGAAAGAATGSACMPGGMPGAPAGAGMPAGVMPAGVGGAAFAGMAAQAGAAAAVAGARRGATPVVNGYEAADDQPGEAQMAACMGLTPKEYAEYTDPTHGESRQPTNKEMKRQAKLASKIDVARFQSCMLQGNSSP